eukprot:COSAG02_NODE_50772_length_318_cov_0.940639_1_plen_35_part_01
MSTDMGMSLLGGAEGGYRETSPISGDDGRSRIGAG